MGFTASTTQAFQYSLPYEQVFNAATSALPAVKKATLTGADMNARFITFETPFSFTSYGERFVVGFIPNEPGRHRRGHLHHEGHAEPHAGWS